jgi:hypothetical protein
MEITFDQGAKAVPAARRLTRPTERTIKRLFALSGNRCAFPKCTETIVQLTTGIVLGEVCHIKAASPAGPRFDPQQTAAERHGYANLILMCAKHHTVIDADEESYTVERLLKLKATHESTIAAPIADDVAATAVKLLIQQPVVSVNQSGGITARTVYITALPAQPAQRDEAAERRAVLARIRQFHNERVQKLSGSAPQIPVLGGAVLIMHVVPIATFDDPQPKAFARISADPNRFPPIVDRRPRDWKITFDGLTTGSNSEGLQRAQRAYVHVFRSGTVEAAISNLARGQEHNFLPLPQLQSMIIHYGRVYAASLYAAGIQPPFVVVVSVLGVKGMRLLQDFIGSAIPEDLPYGLLTDTVYTFGEAIFNKVPDDDNESAKCLHDILSHLANTAQLSRSPYFDDDGNYMLTVALPAG